MKKMRGVTRSIPILVLVALLASLVPLAGTACSEDEEIPAPVAAFIASLTSGVPGVEVAFTDQSTGEITAWAWEFGDGGTSTSQNPTHTYAAEGDYTVSLMVTGPGGSDTEVKINMIEVGGFLADFTADTASPVFEPGASVTVQFTDTSVTPVGREVTAWEWDLDGDGTTDSTAQNPSHSYDTVNKHTVTLTVTGPEGTATKTREDYLTVTCAEYTPKELILTYAMAQGQTASKPAHKFVELLEAYTDYAVSVVMHPGGTLYGYGVDIIAMMEGAVDIVWTAPYFLRTMFSPSLDPFGGIPRFIVNYEHGRAITEDGRIPTIVNNHLSTMGMRSLGFFESVMGGGHFGTSEITLEMVTTRNGMDGWKLGALRPGVLSPEQKWLGMEEQLVGDMGEVVAAAQGIFDVSGTSWAHLVETGLMDHLKNMMVSFSYSPMLGLMNEASWESLDPNVQDLIINIVVPEAQAYGASIAIQEHQENLKLMAEAADTMNFLGPPEAFALFNAMVADDFGPFMDKINEFKAGLGGLGQQVYDLIVELRPDPVEWSPDQLAMLEYAGIPSPL